MEKEAVEKLKGGDAPYLLAVDAAAEPLWLLPCAARPQRLIAFLFSATGSLSVLFASKRCRMWRHKRGHRWCLTWTLDS